MRRYVTEKEERRTKQPLPTTTALKSTPPLLSWKEEDGRDDPRQRYALYRLCECAECGGTGQSKLFRHPAHGRVRCSACRGEGRTLQLLACAESPEAAGLALVTLAREGEWSECPLGLLDRMGEKGQKWLILPWLPSPRNASDAGKLLRSRRRP
jgi:hypothetical protein